MFIYECKNCGSCVIDERIHQIVFDIDNIFLEWKCTNKNCKYNKHPEISKIHFQLSDIPKYVIIKERN